MKNVLAWIKPPPVFDDEETTRVARLLHIITVFNFTLALVYGVLSQVFSNPRPTVAYVVLAMMLMVGVNWLARRGYVKTASYILVGILWLILTLPPLTSGQGVSQASFSGYLIPTLLAGLLLEGRAGFIMATLSSLSGLFMIAYTHNQGSAVPSVQDDILRWGAHLVFFYATAALLSLATSSVRQSLDRARRGEQALAERNHQLQQAEADLRAQETATRQFMEQLKALHEVSVELAKAATFDELCYQVVALGRSRLGYDRLGLWFLDGDTEFIVGSYGTDEQGQIQDERGQRVPIQYDEQMVEYMGGRVLASLTQDVPLYNERQETVGQGWVAGGKLWDGDRNIGWLFTDNLLRKQPMTDTTLELLALYATMVGHLVTRKRAEERFALAFRRSPAPQSISTIDDARFVDVNDSLARALGFTREEMIGRTAFELNTWADFSQRPAILQRLQEQGQVDEYEVAFRTRSGQILDMLLSFEMIELAGKPHLLGLLQDITERKQAEQALRESEERYRVISEHISDYAYACDVAPDGSYTPIWITVDSFERLTGYRWAEIGMSFEFYHPDDVDAVRQSLQATLEGQPTEGEYRIITRSGETRWIDLHRLPVWDENQGRVIRFYGAVRDITARKQAEQQAAELAFERERMQLLQEFLDTVSHDLKTPLTVINTSLYLLEKVTDPARQQDRIQVIKEQAGLVEKYIQDILTISRLDHTPRLAHDPVDVNDLLVSIEHRLRPRFQDKHLTARLDLQPDLPQVPGDRDELLRVFTNLVENAVDYTPQAGSVTVRSYRGEPGIVVEVSDTGMGISEADLPHVFDRFYRSDRARQLVGKGSGLGLAISHKIIDIHGGRIEVESVPGQGSTFRVWLPALADRQPARSATG